MSTAVQVPEADANVLGSAAAHEMFRISIRMLARGRRPPRTLTSVALDL